MNSLKEIANELKNRDNFLLLGHKIPDGDCIGSILGLYAGLDALGKKATMFLSDKIPSIYFYLSNVELITDELPPQDVVENIIFLDCTDTGRVDDEVAQNLSKDATIFNIDHHVSNKYFGDFNYVDASASATAEIIYELLLAGGVPITENIANPLYAGIVMDTGNFQYNNTSAKTHRIAADLLEYGVNLEETRINLFESKPMAEVLLLAKALENFNISENGKLAWMLLSYQDIDRLNAHGLHPEGLINYTRMIKGVQVGMVFREIEPGVIKIGFRSKKDIDVSLIAQELGGGGHKLAAGASQEGSLATVVTQVLELVEKAVL